ncbi:uncharacterized protein LOC126893175 [Diabrotica virgifera virgifera]|uniref:Retrotransposon gag domain-containing protein n=1 Tax=Diabrotica virgifera virgifera TaxID=50390 RepID=A0ABM5KX52_DIAVI|nr:uncharacterized protein LOC126881842 [Diabrotica virgifera virgifera]XP_050514765.1 uncharacterized protein LOC126890008 [Diabrotica virgifera virgifera]XP_050517277.1 uncharacterized protein LOC126891962 [Diabrotica virgifera virgifera]XP_050519087.1 uncharacterized protein LOC126893175 [Diabrotica virgifera virgifera]
MALIGNIEAFTGVPEEFESYIERLEHLFTVNKVEENMKVSMLITLGGTSLFQVLKNLVAPKKPTEFTFQEVKGKLIKHFSPPVSEIYERFVFNRCEQKADQSISDYSVELRKLANSCNFGQFLEEALRDRFVCGIRDEGTQKKLLGDVDLTFQSACQLALASEVAQKQVKLLSEGGNINVLNRGKHRNPKFRSTLSADQSCKNCGRSHHRGKCPAEKWRCFFCAKFGHVKNFCPDIRPQPVNVVQEEEYNIDSDEVNLLKL